MSVIKVNFGDSGSNSNRPPPAQSEKRGIVSIIMKGQALFTSDPSNEDARFFAHMQGARNRWEKQGKPQSSLETT